MHMGVLAWKSSVAASRVHCTKRMTSTTVATEPDAMASMIARDMPMLPSLRQLSIGFASAYGHVSKYCH